MTVNYWQTGLLPVSWPGALDIHRLTSIFPIQTAGYFTVPVSFRFSAGVSPLAQSIDSRMDNQSDGPRVRCRSPVSGHSVMIQLDNDHHPAAEDFFMQQGLPVLIEQAGIKASSMQFDMSAITMGAMVKVY